MIDVEDALSDTSAISSLSSTGGLDSPQTRPSTLPASPSYTQKQQPQTQQQQRQRRRIQRHHLDVEGLCDYLLLGDPVMDTADNQMDPAEMVRQALPLFLTATISGQTALVPSSKVSQQQPRHHHHP